MCLGLKEGMCRWRMDDNIGLRDGELINNGKTWRYKIQLGQWIFSKPLLATVNTLSMVCRQSRKLGCQIDGEDAYDGPNLLQLSN